MATPEPPVTVMRKEPGRDYTALLQAFTEIIRMLIDERSLIDSMEATFPIVVQAFSAQKALILEPTEGGLRVLAHTADTLRADHIAAIKMGKSVRGVSSSIIQTVLQERRPAVVQNPMFLQGARSTASLAGTDYSVLAGPVLAPGRTDVMVIYYFQTHSLDLQLAYSERDFSFFDAFLTLLEVVNLHHLKLTSTHLPDVGTLKEVRDMVTRELILRRLDLHDYNYNEARKSLKLAPSYFYELLNRHGIDKKGTRLAFEKAVEETRQELRGEGEDASDEDDELQAASGDSKDEDE